VCALVCVRRIIKKGSEIERPVDDWTIGCDPHVQVKD